jgi:hypothetical protein
LTYDTVWPLFLVVVAIAYFETIRQASDSTARAYFLAALIASSLLASPFIVPYFLSRVGYYRLGEQGWQEGAVLLWTRLLTVLDSWFVQVRSDFLYNRKGPILNALLLPWLTFGFAIAIANIRHRIAYWCLIWAALIVFPIPILLNSPYGRVYYPALPAVYALTALGLFVFVQDGMRVLGERGRPFFLIVLLVGIIWLPIFNFYIYFNEVADYPDRQMRRELGEMILQAAGPETLILLPTVPYANEALNNERQVIELFMLKKIPIAQISESYLRIRPDELLTFVSIAPTDRPNVEIVLDKFTPGQSEKYRALSDALRACYPQGKLIEGRWFDRFSLSAAARENPACLASKLEITSDNQGGINWSLSQGTATGIALLCGVQTEEHLWIEAETFAGVPSGWKTGINFVSDWSGDGFLMDGYQSAPARQRFESNAERDVYLWVRFYKRAADGLPGLIKLNGQTSEFGMEENEIVQKWVWERVGPFRVSKGMMEILIGHRYAKDSSRFMGLFVDAIVISPHPNFNPEEDHYRALPTERFEVAPPLSAGKIALDLSPGIYQCRAETKSPLPLVDAWGRAPVTSDAILIEVNP